jgi:hypothetical protein
MIREKLNAALLDYKDINLESCVAREALIDRIVTIVQGEQIESKYWRVESNTNIKNGRQEPGFDHRGFVKNTEAGKEIDGWYFNESTTPTLTGN